MGIRYYDEALYNKIQNWVKDPNVRILKPEQTSLLFRQKADMIDDKPITLPLIALSRENSFEILHTGKRPISFAGKILSVTENKTIMKLNAIPISLNYQLDIYTRKFVEADEYLREFIFKLINNPALTIEIPYNDINFKHNCYLSVLTDVQDNSDVEQKLFHDQFTRWTIKIIIDNAYLFSAPINDMPELDKITLNVCRQQGGQLIVDESSDITTT